MDWPTCSIVITNKHNHKVINYNYIVLKHLWNKNKTHLHGLKQVYFKTTYDMNKWNYKSVRIDHWKKEKTHWLLLESCMGWGICGVGARTHTALCAG